MRFTYFLPAWAVILGIGIVAGITVFGYFQLKRPLQRTHRFALIALRILAAAILLGCLLAPVILEKRDVTPPTHLSILVDTSRSMALEDTPAGETGSSRISQVNHLLFDESSQFLQTLERNYKLHLYRFDTGLYQSPIPTEDFEPIGNLTDVATALQETARAWKGQPTAGVVLLTDGAHNGSNFQIEDIVALETPIYAIGLGSTQAPKDIQIQNVDVAPIAYTGHENVIRVTIVQTGYTTESARVSMREADSNRLVDAAMLTFTPDASEPATAQSMKHVVTLKMTPETEGNFQYKVMLPTLAGELTEANNQKTFSLKVVKAKLKVFYLEGRPRWEYAFLKRVLERDPDLETTTTVLSAKARPESLLNRSGSYYPQGTLGQLPRFPETREELFKYDVLILGDLSAEHLTVAQQEMIIDFVEMHGKAVIFLPSHAALGRNGFRNTALSRLLPIQIPVNGCREQKVDFALSLTQAGAFHPILQLSDTYERNTKLWQNLPPLSRVFRGFQLRAGAISLIESQGGEPILLFQRVGLGKSLLIAAEGVWNWHFGVGAFRDTAYQTVYPRFWAQTLRWMGQQSDVNRIYITTAAPTYAQGDTARLTIRAYSQTFQPQTDAEIQVSVTTPKGATFPIRTRVETTETENSNAGIYTAQLTVDEKGTYRIRATGTAGNIPLGEDEINIHVHPQLAELESPQLNEMLLKQLADRTGGVYLTIAEAQSLPEKIEVEQKPIFVDAERDLWAHPIILLTVVGLLGTEWFIRKRIGLV